MKLLCMSDMLRNYPFINVANEVEVKTFCKKILDLRWPIYKVSRHDVFLMCCWTESFFVFLNPKHYLHIHGTSTFELKYNLGNVQLSLAKSSISHGSDERRIIIQFNGKYLFTLFHKNLPILASCMAWHYKIEKRSMSKVSFLNTNWSYFVLLIYALFLFCS